MPIDASRKEALAKGGYSLSASRYDEDPVQPKRQAELNAEADAVQAETLEAAPLEEQDRAFLQAALEAGPTGEATARAKKSTKKAE